MEPFIRDVDGTTFGWRVDELDGDFSIDVEPGGFIACYAPWDGLGYDS